MKKKLAIAVSLFLVTGVGFAGVSECPDLTGVFDCRAEDPNYGAMFMRLTRTEETATTVLYTYEYRFKRDQSTMRLEVRGSAEGTRNENINAYGVCRDGGFYISRDPADLSRSSRNSIDADGNYLNSSTTNPERNYLCHRIF